MTCISSLVCTIKYYLLEYSIYFSIYLRERLLRAAPPAGEHLFRRYTVRILPSFPRTLVLRYLAFPLRLLRLRCAKSSPICVYISPQYFFFQLNAKKNGPARDRTLDLVVNSHTLYLLSYKANEIFVMNLLYKDYSLKLKIKNQRTESQLLNPCIAMYCI